MYEFAKTEQVIVVGQVRRLGRSISVWQKCLSLAIKHQCMQGNWQINPDVGWGQNSQMTMEDRERATEELERMATETEREAPICKRSEVRKMFHHIERMRYRLLLQMDVDRTELSSDRLLLHDRNIVSIGRIVEALGHRL